MKNFILAVVIAMFFGSALADGSITFNLQSVRVADLARAVVDDVAGASLVVASPVIEDQSPINFIIKNASVSQVMMALQTTLDRQGYALERQGGVYYLGKKPKDETDVFTYRPLYRSVSYLSDLLGGVIGRQAIATQRHLPQNPQIQNMPLQGQETATNVQGMIDRGDKDTLVIKATPKELQQVKRMLAEVDRPVPELLVKAVVLEVQTGNIEGSALNLLAKVVSKGAGVSLGWTGGASAENGVKVKIDGLEAIWTAISSDSRFKVISAPQLRVKSGGSARFSVGADTPVLGAVTYQQNGQPIQSVEYKPSGVILELKPDIRGKLAELQVFQQLSNFAKTETGVNNSPTLLKREIRTSVIVEQNDVVLLGGLDEEKTSETDQGLFFMPSFMRSKNSDKGKTEIVLMLHVESVRTVGTSEAVKL